MKKNRRKVLVMGIISVVVISSFVLGTSFLHTKHKEYVTDNICNSLLNLEALNDDFPTKRGWGDNTYVDSYFLVDECANRARNIFRENENEPLSADDFNMYLESGNLYDEEAVIWNRETLTFYRNGDFLTTGKTENQAVYFYTKVNEQSYLRVVTTPEVLGFSQEDFLSNFTSLEKSVPFSEKMFNRFKDHVSKLDLQKFGTVFGNWTYFLPWNN